MKALVWSAVVNGIVAVPLTVIMILLASSRTVTGRFVAPWPLVAPGCGGTGLMAATCMLSP